MSTSVIYIFILYKKYSKLGEYGKAIELDQNVYDKTLKMFGEDHPETI